MGKMGGILKIAPEEGCNDLSNREFNDGLFLFLYHLTLKLQPDLAAVNFTALVQG